MYNSAAKVFYVRKFNSTSKRFELTTTVTPNCPDTTGGTRPTVCSINLADVKVFAKGQLGSAYPVIYYKTQTYRARE